MSRPRCASGSSGRSKSCTTCPTRWRAHSRRVAATRSAWSSTPSRTRSSPRSPAPSRSAPSPRGWAPSSAAPASTPNASARRWSGWPCRGCVPSSSRPPRATHDYLRRFDASFPMVMVDRTVALPGYDTVRVDDAGLAHRAVAHLCSHGHRRIAFVGSDERFETTRDRLSGYRRALADVGVEPRPELGPPRSHPRRRRGRRDGGPVGAARAAHRGLRGQSPRRDRCRARAAHRRPGRRRVRQLRRLPVGHAPCARG